MQQLIFMKNSKSIEISKVLWYAKPEGLALLREIDTELKQQFSNCQMYRTPSGQIYFTFKEGQDMWKIELPDDFPYSSPSFRVNERQVNTESEWTPHSKLLEFFLKCYRNYHNFPSLQNSGTQRQNAIIPSPFTGELKKLQRRFPVVGDKALIDLINGIQVSQDIVRYRKNQGFFGRLFDTFNGKNRQRQILLEENLLAGQQALTNWVCELTDSLRISQVALQITQQSLLEARNAIRSQQQEFINFKQQLNQLVQYVDARFNQLEKQIHQLEVRLSANEDLDRIVTAWEAGRTYTQLPWVVQVVLLTREVFSSAVVTYELETSDTQNYREWLADKIISKSQQLPKNSFSLADLLEQSWRDIEHNDLELSATLLEIRSIPQQRLLKTPHLFAMGTTLELATLPESIRPEKIGQCAFELSHAHIGNLSRTTDARELIEAVIEETANDCLTLMARR
jgi:hypothetical protein